jgi:hypothetical protein
MSSKQLRKSLADELLHLQRLRTLTTLELPAVVRAAALRETEVSRGMPTSSRVNKIELDLFTILFGLVVISTTILGIVGVLVLLLPDAPSI